MESDKIKIFDLEKKKIFEEAVPAEIMIKIIYQNDTFTALSLRSILCKNALFSRFIGYIMRQFWTKEN